MFTITINEKQRKKNATIVEKLQTSTTKNIKLTKQTKLTKLTKLTNELKTIYF